MLHCKHFVHTLFILVVVLLMSGGTALGVSSITPPTATSSVGQTVAFNVQTIYRIISPVITCNMQINFGDTAAWSTLNPGCNTTNGTINPSTQRITCRNQTNHIYNTPGNYTVSVRPEGTGRCLPFILLPDRASAIVNVAPNAPPQEITLTDGVVGMEYLYAFSNPRYNYRLIAGRLPPGIRVLRNSLGEIPDLEGRYRFQIRTTAPTGAVTNIWYNLTIKKAQLTIATTPKEVDIARNKAGSFRLNYNFSSSEQLNDTLTSTRGIFLAGSTQLGSISSTLSGRLVNGSGQASEQITVPLSVIKKAQRIGINKIRYQRTFSARYMNAATTGSMAIAVGTDFAITTMRIHFTDDRSSKKFVKRNEKGISAEIELRYEGAGLLKGYWQVDDRILARVTKNLTFAKSRTLTLRLPKTPPLPTHATGSHRLRFVITAPVMNIAFPQVIYIVTGDDLSANHPVILLSPADNAEITASEMAFAWKKRTDASIYRIDFFEDDAKEVIFSAFIKKSRYTVPSALLSKKFGGTGTFSWQVTGLNLKNIPNSQSKRAYFSLLPSSTAVPGRLLLLLDKTAMENDTLLQEILQSDSELIIGEEIPLPTLGLTLIFLNTKGDRDKIAKQLQATHKGLRIQPDYYYFTHGAIIEGRNREELFSFLQLKPPGTGKGIMVAIIDTGVDLQHFDLAPNLLDHANFIKDSSYQGEIHGTAVAGIIAAAENRQGMAGIAPQASILALRACEQIHPDKTEGRCYSSSLLQAIDSAMAHKATIINMSLGSPMSDQMLSIALHRAAEQGILLVAPVGNDPALQTLSFPASHPNVISVAGQTESGAKLPNPVVAKQADMVLPASYLQIPLLEDRVSFMSGTSMASAAASGLLADYSPDSAGIKACMTAEDFITCLGKTR